MTAAKWPSPAAIITEQDPYLGKGDGGAAAQEVLR
jgi:hypothetical protein